METISVSALKTHLSAELKKVQKGMRITVVEHKRPVAVIGPIEKVSLFVREASIPYRYAELSPLTATDPLRYLAEDRGDR